MGKINGLHHVAIATGDMKTQLQFFNDICSQNIKRFGFGQMSMKIKINIQGHFWCF